MGAGGAAALLPLVEGARPAAAQQAREGALHEQAAAGLVARTAVTPDGARRLGERPQGYSVSA